MTRPYWRQYFSFASLFKVLASLHAMVDDDGVFSVIKLHLWIFPTHSLNDQMFCSYFTRSNKNFKDFMHMCTLEGISLYFAFLYIFLTLHLPTFLFWLYVLTFSSREIPFFFLHSQFLFLMHFCDVNICFRVLGWTY